MKRICYKCKKEKELSEFPKNKTKTEGYDYLCKECGREYQNKYYINNKEKLDKINKEWYYNNIDKKKEYDREYYNTERGKEVRKNAIQKYEKTEKGKLVNCRKSGRRRKNLKWEELFINPFPEEIEINYHHINNILVIPIPRVTHESCYCGKNINKHRELCKKWTNLIYGNIEDLIMSCCDETI